MKFRILQRCFRAELHRIDTLKMRLDIFVVQCMGYEEGWGLGFYTKPPVLG